MNVAISKAPAGGMTSKVNGEFYEGGKFMPTHGLFCGKVGEKRRKKADDAARRNRFYEIGSKEMYEVTTYAGGGVWNILGIIIADSKDDAKDCAKTLAKVTTYVKKV